MMTFKVSRRLALGLLASAAACGSALARQPLSKEPQDYLKIPPKPASIKGPFSLVAIGDLLNSRPTADNPDVPFQKALAIVRGGDVAIGNREGVILDLPTFKGQPYGNGQMYGEASLAGDMKAMGVDMASMANNHSTDWGWEGVIEAGRLLDGVGIVHSGSGRTLAEARKAGILTTPKGKVALVSAASTYKVNAGANDAFDEGVPARPGINALRLRKVNLVDAEQMAAVRALAIERASPLSPAPKFDARDVTFGDEIYRLASTPGSGPRIAYEMELHDHAAMLKAVREAKAQADLVVYSIHAHESPTGLDDDTPTPPDFLLTLFHQCVDAGADVILGGGPHAVRGIEIYKGKPILYGMGLFMLKAQIKAMQETVFRMWPDLSGHAPKPEAGGGGGGTPPRWLEGVIAVVDYDAHGRERQVRLYPIDLSGGGDRALRGLPRLAEGETAARILAGLRADSAAFGTKIQIKDATGLIRIR